MLARTIGVVDQAVGGSGTAAGQRLAARCAEHAVAADELPLVRPDARARPALGARVGRAAQLDDAHVHRR